MCRLVGMSSQRWRQNALSLLVKGFGYFSVLCIVKIKDRYYPSIRDGVHRSGMLLHLHLLLREFKIFFHPAKFDNFKDEPLKPFKTVSVSQSKNLLD